MEDHSVNADIRDVSFTIYVVVAIPLLPELRNNADEATVSIVHFNIYVLLGLHNIHMSCT